MTIPAVWGGARCGNFRHFFDVSPAFCRLSQAEVKLEDPLYHLQKPD